MMQGKTLDRSDARFRPSVYSLCIFLMGFCSSLCQVVLIRELIVVFSGNELSIGIILSSWLMWGAGGSFVASRISRSHMNLLSGMVSLQLLLGLSFFASLYVARCAKALVGLPVGQVVPLTTMVWLSAVLLMPTSTLGGMLFACGSKIWNFISRTSRMHALPYSLESIGAAAGGLLSLVAIQDLHSFHISQAIGVLCAISSLMIIVAQARDLAYQRSLTHRVALWKALTRTKLQRLNVAMLLALIVTSGFADLMQTKSATVQWSGCDLRLYQNSIFGNIAVTRNEEQFTLHVDGVPVYSLPTPDIATVEEVVHLPLLFHASPNRVLLLGGGIGGALTEVLKHNVTRVDYAELDPLLVRVAERFLEPSVLGHLDPRVKVDYADGRFFVVHATSKYDVVLIDLPSPSTILLNRMYTKEFFASVKRLIDKEGLLSVPLIGSSSYLSQELAFLNACILTTLKSVFRYVRPIPGDMNLFLASDSLNLDEIHSEILIDRLQNRRLETAFLSESHIEYKLDPKHSQWFLKSVSQATNTRINTDLLPSAVFYYLWMWNSQLSESGARIFASVKDLSPLAFLLPTLILLLALFAVSRRRSNRQVGFWWMVLSTGFFGMMSSIVLATVFQSIFGYVYHVVGLLSATFMFGLFLGSLIQMRIKRSPRTSNGLVLMDVAVLGISILLPGAIALIYSSGLPTPSLGNGLGIFFLSLLSGVIVGAQFSAANGFIEGGTPGSSFRQGLPLLYSCDLAGAWMGALAVSLLLPVLGVLDLWSLVVALKATSAITLLVTRRS